MEEVKSEHKKSVLRGDGFVENTTMEPEKQEVEQENPVGDKEELDKEENYEELSFQYSFPIQFGKQKKTSAQTPQVASTPYSGESTNLLRSLIQESSSRNSLAQKLQVHRSEKASVNALERQETSDIISKDPVELDKNFIPQAQHFSFEAHCKSVVAMTINTKGSRLITGGADSDVRLWDFHGMTSQPSPFRQISPTGGHAICAVSYSLSGKQFLCAAGDSVCRLYNADAQQIQETVKGDMYIRDTAQTKGHTHAVNDCQWHPINENLFVTASSDATVRIFDVNAKPYGVYLALPHLHVLKAIDHRNLNIAGQCRVTTCCCSPITGNFIIGGCSDGSLQLWNHKRVYGKPDRVIRGSHLKDSEIVGLIVCKDEQRVISRATDGTLKLWDTRNFKSPVHVWENLPFDHIGKNICVNPEESMIVVGTTSLSGTASIKFFDLESSYELIHEVSVMRHLNTNMQTTAQNVYSVTSLLWPETLNQLVVGGSDGFLHMFYDQQFSAKGALLFAHKPAVSRKETLQGFQQPVFNFDEPPPGFRQTRGGELRRVRKGQDKFDKNANPERVIGIAQHASSARNFNSQDSMLDKTTAEDPVEILRSYEEDTRKDPIFVAHAYKKTQPITKLDYSMEGEDHEKLIESVSKCPRCGLKLCQCGYMRLAQAIKGPDATKMRKIT